MDFLLFLFGTFFGGLCKIFYSMWRGFLRAKLSKRIVPFFIVFQTSRFGDFFLPFPRWIFAAALGGILFLFPCENWGISEFQTLSREILMGE